MLDVSYQIVRSDRRKRVSLEIDSDGRLTVHAPLFTPESEIAEIVRKERFRIAAARMRMAVKKAGAVKENGVRAEESETDSGQETAYRIVRSARRKHAQLSVDSDGKLTVNAPFSMPESKIAEFVKRERDWIKAARERAAARRKEAAAKSSESQTDSAQNVPYRIERSARRIHAALVMDSGGQLIVRVPMSMPDSKIAELVKEKQAWINAAQKRAEPYARKYQRVTAEAGSRMLYLGRLYTISRPDAETVQISGDTMIVPKFYGIADFIIWLRRQAVRVLSERVIIYENKMKVRPASVKLSDARSRWGVCSSRNNIRFVWRLVMCPLEVIDYVVVHELSHINHKNHGKKFWASVASVLPDYKRRRQWLKDNRRLMDII
ncbi:M48 family metallopeptidase [bacterium]|nr:M48 family metallopeptidase [bacterium]